MPSHSFRYRFAPLLIWAVVAMITNPVWHAVGHCISDHHSDAPEHVFDVQWGELEICPYCDAVSQYADALDTTVHIGRVVHLWNVIPLKIRYTDHRLLITTRLRAPPFLV